MAMGGDLELTLGGRKQYLGRNFRMTLLGQVVLEILAGRMHGPSPPQIWGDRPPDPLKSPPMLIANTDMEQEMRGERLLEFAPKHELMITPGLF